MKILIPFLSLLGTSCTQYNVTPEVHVTPKVQVNISNENLNNTRSETASNLIQKLQAQDYKTWKTNAQKIRDTYARVIKVLENKEAIDFTIAFFKTLSVSEELDQQVWDLSNHPNEFPNTNTLKFLYKTEKTLDEMIAILAPFANSSNHEVQYCAVEAGKYFEYQKDLFKAVRDMDYRAFKTSDMPQRIPPEVLRAHARLLEQRDQMTDCIISFYANMAERKQSK